MVNTKKSLSNLNFLLERIRTVRKTSRGLRAAKFGLLSLFSVYCVLILFPNVLFAHKFEQRNFNIYTNQESGGLHEAVSKAESRLRKSPLYDPDLEHDIFVSDSFNTHWYTTLSPNAFGNTDPFTKNIRINKSDFESDTTFRPSVSKSTRSFSGVLAHEVMHNQLRETFGLVKYLRFPVWKNEGYCEYVAKPSKVSLKQGFERWGDGNKDPAQKYFEYHQMVSYLLGEKGVTPVELFEKQFDETFLREKTLEYLKRKIAGNRRKNHGK